MSAGRFGQILLIVWGWIGLSSAYAPDQNADVPIHLQAALLVKATPFCRTLPEKLNGGKFVVGVLYQEKYRASLQAFESLKVELAKASGTPPIETKGIRVGEDGKVPPDALKGLSAAYLTPMRGADLPAIFQETSKFDIWSVAVNAADCRKGATMSFELVDTRPKFLINLKSAAAENCDFSSQLLKLANTF